MPDNTRYLMTSADQREFWGIGMNVRSPYDTRYVASFPFTTWDYTDFDIYDRLLARYAASGVNVVEVWMSPWWLALEWIPDAPGNHGLGHMNQYRAWKIDRLLELAHKYDIYVILVINNHGKFSAWIDSDWGRNPFNKENGGPLDTPMEYFSAPIAKQYYRRLADYLVARWGYSPNILAWKLFTEIDLTGDNRSWYKDESVREWHRFAASYLQQIDPNQHLVTTHWATSYEMVNPELAKIPELDILTLDIYYGASGAKHFFDYLFATDRFVDTMEKPAIITEFGGSPYGDTLPHLLNQLHMALWGGFFTRYPVTPCFWWFPLVEEIDLYDRYAAVARYTAGENRTDTTAHHRAVGDDLFLCELRAKDRRYLWLLDTRHYFGGSLTVSPTVHADLQLDLPELAPGRWSVEYWNCRTGSLLAPPTEFTVASDAAKPPTLRLPAFSRDIALKVRAVQSP